MLFFSSFYHHFQLLSYIGHDKNMSLLVLLNETKTNLIIQLSDIVTPVFTTVNPIINKRRLKFLSILMCILFQQSD